MPFKGAVWVMERATSSGTLRLRARIHQEVHYSPHEDLARIDAGLINQAKNSID